MKFLSLNVWQGRLERVQLKHLETLDMDFGWFTIEQIEQMKDQLRGVVIIDQARDVLSSKMGINT